ncbi:MAG: hypothetical protein MK180_14815 [Rhodobacteraceae bacterium]|nr:hypothetical protein [Paracoccaceae bacterium]
MKITVPLSALAFVFAMGAASAETDTTGQERAPCNELVALFMELARRSGQPASEAEARQEVLEDNPSQSECASMLALFPPLE